MLKALLFDFDGVIVDTETVWYYIYKDWLLQNYNYELDVQDYLVCVGASSEALFQFIEHTLGNDVGIRAFEKQAMQTFIERTKRLPAMQGVVSLFQQAKALNLKIAIATSATLKKPMFHLERLQLLDYIDAISSAELSTNIKPAPDIFLKAAQLLQCKSEECLAIEDSKNGLESALSAHMKCLIVPNVVTASSDFTGAYCLKCSLNEVNLEEIMKDFQEA